jgi:hypothetical protein
MTRGRMRGQTKAVPATLERPGTMAQEVSAPMQAHRSKPSSRRHPSRRNLIIGTIKAVWLASLLLLLAVEITGWRF